MIHICGDCGLSKDCTNEEFMGHLWLHDELDKLLDDLLVEQEKMQITVTPEQ